MNEPFVKRTTGIQNLDSRAYLGTRVDIPTLQEQRKLVELLDEQTGRIDELVQEVDRQEGLQNELLQAELVDQLIPNTATKQLAVTRLKYLFEPEWPGVWGNEPEPRRTMPKSLFPSSLVIP